MQMTGVRGGEPEIRGKTRNNMELALRLNCMSELKSGVSSAWRPPVRAVPKEKVSYKKN